MGDGLDMPAASLKVLKRIAENVAAHPGEKKYRKLNLSKAKIEKVCTRNGGHKLHLFLKTKRRRCIYRILTLRMRMPTPTAIQ